MRDFHRDFREQNQPGSENRRGRNAEKQNDRTVKAKESRVLSLLGLTQPPG